MKTQVKIKNDYFKLLTKVEKRVEIAKDVLLQLKSKKYFSCPGEYIYILNETDIQSNFNKIKCEVCALGAVAMSCIKFTNNVTFKEVVIGSENIWKDLRKIFSDKQLILIEFAFEGYTPSSFGKAGDWKIKLTKLEIFKTFDFYSKYNSPDKRLKAIMRNIVKNNGSFLI